MLHDTIEERLAENERRVADFEKIWTAAFRLGMFSGLALGFLLGAIVTAAVAMKW